MSKRVRPDDMRVVLERGTHCAGFHGASSMKWLPTGIAMTRQVQTFAVRRT